jgi:murein L,D-transpeptidase YcbB/YkuD
MFYRIVTLLFIVFITPDTFATVDNPDVRAHIQAYVERLNTTEVVPLQNTFIASEIVLPALYRQRQYEPVWQNIQSIHQLLEILSDIDADGLDANDYHFKELLHLQNVLWQSDHDNATLQAEYDLLLTDSLIRLGYHLLVGKVDPVQLDSQWNMDNTIGSLEMVLNLAAAIDVGNVDKLVDKLRPNSRIYTNLRSAVVRYRDIAANGGWKVIPQGSTIRPGMTDPRVVDLRKRLLTSGDYTGEETPSVMYDSDLVEAVSLFQYRHGLHADGLVGNKTISIMNIPVEEKIAKLVVNLERARWVLHDLPEEFVLADIAGFTVSYYRQGQVIWSTRAQVGQPYRKTPIFRSRIRYLVMNPTWTVPTTILEEDILPKLHQDPGYLQKKRLYVLDFKGNPVNQSEIDWSLYPDKKFPYMLRQEPGPSGALGRIKFMFPNEHSVYLHDTPYRSLFANNMRAFSSGCIRIEKPYELAELLLRDSSEWNRDAILKTIDSLENRSVSLPEAVTIILFYWTAGVDNNGKVLFRSDIYERDEAIVKGLSSRFSFRKKPVLDDDIQAGKPSKRLIPASLTQAVDVN